MRGCGWQARGMALKSFAQLFNELDASTATNAKVDALKRYFDQVIEADAACCLVELLDEFPVRQHLEWPASNEEPA